MLKRMLKRMLRRMHVRRTGQTFGNGAFILLCGLTPAAALGQTPEQRYLDWTEPTFPAAEYVARRAALVEELRRSGADLFLTISADGESHGETFRQLDDFWYFTGLELPRSALVVDARSGEVTVFAPARDPRFDRPPRTNDFPGRPLASDRAIFDRVGLDRVEELRELEPRLRSWHAAGRRIHLNPGPVSGSTDPGPFGTADPIEQLVDYLRWLEIQPRSARDAVARVRSVKTVAEQAVMRRAAEVTGEAIRRAAAEVEPGVDERTLEAAFEGACKRQGSQRIAFASIIKSGPNSLWPWRILASHYDRRNRPMDAGDLVIFDVGCEFDGYVSDVGRTFPVGGSFSPEQAETLRMTVGVSDAIIAAVRPGVTLEELQEVADAAIPEPERRYMQTGLFFGHHLGLSTGDPVLTDEPLRPGMVFTIEPWYYNHDQAISVFTEDVVLVTETGVEVLTGFLPRSPQDLERWVRDGGR